MGSLGGDCAGGGADEEPLGGAADPAPRAAAAGDAHSVVTFASERGGFLAFVGEVAVGCGELALAGLAVDGKAVEGLQIFRADLEAWLSGRPTLPCCLGFL